MSLPLLNYYLNKPEETAESLISLKGGYQHAKVTLMMKEGHLCFA